MTAPIDDRLAEACSDVRGISALLKVLALEDNRALLEEAELGSALWVLAESLSVALKALEACQSEATQITLVSSNERLD
jgi:hypothetical protein